MPLGLELVSPKRFKLGVLLVHGIGTQPLGETLVRAGDMLVQTIRQATQKRIDPAIELAASGEQRAEMIVRLGDARDSERWLISEGWWANSFPAPRYAELVSWSIRALPWFVATHVAQRYWQADRSSVAKRIVASIAATLQLVVLFAFTPLFLVLMALMLLLGLLPIPQIRTFILATQSALTATVGDSLAFVESPVRAALVRTRILGEIRRHKELCERTVVVAHSQGAAVVLDALGGIAYPDYEARKFRFEQPETPGLVPDLLITFGAGIKPLVSQIALSAGLLKKAGMNPSWYAITALVGFLFLATSTVIDVYAGRTNVRGILDALVDLAIVFAGVMLAFWIAKPVIKFLGGFLKPIQKHEQAIYLGVGMLCMLGFVAFMWFQSRSSDHFDTLVYTSLAFFMLLGSIVMILSRDFDAMLAGGARIPPGLKRWIDLYASADPVPNGATGTRDPRVPKSVQIWNRNSITGDHSAYWENADGFVLRIVRASAETAGSSWLAHLPLQLKTIDTRAQWRCRFLKLASSVNWIVWAYAGLIVWFRHGDVIPLPVKPPSWIPLGMAQVAAIVVLSAGCAWACSGILRWLWQQWVRQEQTAVLTGTNPDEANNGSYFVMGLMLWLVFFALFAFGHDGAASIGKILLNPKDLFQVLIMAFSLTLASHFVLQTMIPAPIVQTHRPWKSAVNLLPGVPSSRVRASPAAMPST